MYLYDFLSAVVEPDDLVDRRIVSLQDTGELDITALKHRHHTTLGQQDWSLYTHTHTYTEGERGRVNHCILIYRHHVNPVHVF